MGMENLPALADQAVEELGKRLKRWCNIVAIVSGILIVVCIAAIYVLSKPF